MKREPDFNEIGIRLEMACQAVLDELQDKEHTSLAEYTNEMNDKIDQVAERYIKKYEDSEMANTLLAIIETYKRRCIRNFQEK